jgi:holliday junction DNA helicase RuvB
MKGNADTLRPTVQAEFVGQKKLLSRVNVGVRAARAENRPLDHVLLAGPPGFGKTTLAGIIAADLEDPLEFATMPLTERALTQIVLRHHGVLLLDEIHRASPRQQEMLLPLLEFGYVVDNRGRKTVNTWLTIIGATTEPQKIIPPLYDRFAIKPRFEPYSTTELGRIVKGMARKADVTMSQRTAEVLGMAAGGTPRNARQLVLAARDLWFSLGRLPRPKEILDLCGVEADGLTDHHLAYLNALDSLGGEAGLKLIATSVRLHESVCMDLERLLIERGFIKYGDRGRSLTADGVRRATGSYTHRPDLEVGNAKQHRP